MDVNATSSPVSAGLNAIFDRTMNAIRLTVVSAILLPMPVLCGYAQTAGKPVLTAAPNSSAPASMPNTADTGGQIDPSTYIIGPGDDIQVTVYENPQMSPAGPLMVRPDGIISLPLINEVQAAGLTPMQLQAALTERFKKFVIDPTVGVTVINIKSKSVYLMGEVGHVGPIAMAPGMTVLEAIATAGGLTPYANSKKIYILRGNGARKQQIHFDYKTAIKKGDMQGITLEPGDTIVVP
jgi:polysaccharide export outer membrane protein